MQVISNCYGACERIVRSNVPASYSRHLSRFLSVWCFTLPIVLVNSLQWMMIPVVSSPLLLLRTPRALSLAAPQASGSHSSDSG